MITRDNYEEFFLLYIDNELSVTDRRLVEDFVRDNPDLKEEWESLLQCRLHSDTAGGPVFADKEGLMKFSGEGGGIVASGGLSIDGDNYEEFFISYIDGELDEKDRQSVEEFVLRYPSKLPELEMLRRTVSLPDIGILFPDKERLYRSATRRPVLVYWWRIAAAAVVLLAVGLLLFSSRHSVKTGPATNPELVDAGKSPEDPTKNPKDPIKNLAGNDPSKKVTAPVTPATPDALYSSGRRQQDQKARETEATALAAANATKKKLATDPDPKQNQTTNMASTQHERPVTPEEKTELAVTERPNTSVAAVDAGRLPGNAVITASLPDASGEEAVSREKSSFATQALTGNAAASIDDPGGDLSNDNDDTEAVSTKKNKLRGVFRKVSRAFGKTADRDDDGQRKVLIGAFQVALK